jgi:predicted 2-oxoglutarate/Fe(II)-dependent dioxygenase YbiX
MELKNNYYWFQSALSPEVCDEILKLGKEKLKSEEESGISTEAYTFGDTQKNANPDAISQQDMIFSDALKKSKKIYNRDSNITWLSEQWMYDLVYPYINTANVAAGWNWNYEISEPFQFTKYDNDQFYGWHNDGKSDSPYERYIHGVTSVPLHKTRGIPSGYTRNQKFVGKIRKISMTINLCEPGEYEGGNLKFDFGPHRGGDEKRYHVCEEIRPRGSIIIFPSFVHHCVTPVTRGTRYSLVLWTLGEPWK